MNRLVMRSEFLHSASLLLCLVLILASIQTAISGSATRTLQGTFQALVGHLPGNIHYQQFYLQTANDSFIALEIPHWILGESDNASKLSGSQVEVRITEEALGGSDSGHYRRHVLSLDSVPPPLRDRHEEMSQKKAGRGVPRRRTLQQVSAEGTAPHGPVRMIVFIMDLTQCGTAKPVTTPQVRSMKYLPTNFCTVLNQSLTRSPCSLVQNVMNFIGNTWPQNLASFFQTCSMQNTELDTSGSVSFNIPFPCSGKLADGTNFDTRTCQDNVIPWIRYAEQYVITKFGVNIDAFQHRLVYISLLLSFTAFAYV